ncbi:MAG: OpgC domain-containing protein [Pseudomonadota bacterium]
MTIAATTRDLDPPVRAARPEASAAAASVRDPRLDFFRGLAMFIILIAHVPGNWLTLWIPARFGFSDATEIFVFCSGMASAIAFGRTFERAGWRLGTARVGFRVWQVYWAHIGLFFAIAAAMAALNATELFARDYVGQLNLYPFFNNTERDLPRLLMLIYVPNYFDILPMYLVILAMMPVVVALASVNRYLAFAAVILVWIMAQADILALPAEAWSDREWFFNPFGWQLIFFTGFAFMIGWLPPPPVNRQLVIAAALVVLIIVPVAYFRIYREVEVLSELRSAIAFWRAKTDFGLLRYVHFLALAYLAWVAVGPQGSRLVSRGTGVAASVWRGLLGIILKVGQQSLAVFVTSMFLARLLGVALDVLGRNHFSMAVVNLTGMAILVGVAYGVAWFKGQPWRHRRAADAGG